MACEEGVRNRNFYIANLFASEKRIGLPNIASLVILVEPKKQPFQQIPLVSGKKDVKVFLVQTGGFLGIGFC